jgi:hypothetical protein
MAVTRDTSGAAGLDQALVEIVERTAELSEADVVVARLSDAAGGLIARAVHATSAALQAELEGSRISAGSVPDEEHEELLQLPLQLQRLAEQLGANAVLQLPVRARDAVVGSLELMRRRGPFDERARAFARAAADQVALARQAFGDGNGTHLAVPDLLELTGDALAAGSDEARAAEQVAALAAEATGAEACLIWRYEAEGPVLSALSGPATAVAPPATHEAVRRAQASVEPIAVEVLDDPATGGSSASRLSARSSSSSGQSVSSTTPSSRGSAPSPSAPPTRCGRASGDGRSPSSSSALERF